MEETGLFARVTLLDTTKEVFLTEGATAFRIQCSLDEPAKRTATGTGTGATAGGASAKASE
jgi:hypothetical protein